MNETELDELAQRLADDTVSEIKSLNLSISAKDALFIAILTLEKVSAKIPMYKGDLNKDWEMHRMAINKLKNSIDSKEWIDEDGVVMMHRFSPDFFDMVKNESSFISIFSSMLNGKKPYRVTEYLYLKNQIMEKKLINAFNKDEIIAKFIESAISEILNENN